MYVKPQTRAGWTFLSNHAHVLIALAHDSEYRVRDLAQLVGITERAVLQILSDLENGGVVKRHRVGRRNTYQLDATIALRHPLEAHRTVADILAMAAKVAIPPSEVISPEVLTCACSNAIS
jgi:predicted ArsR family transcriptional regulator